MIIHAIDEYNDGGHLLYARDDIGAYARGRTREEALGKLPCEIARYREWLGLPTEAVSGVEIVQEKRSALQICEADSNVLFASELPPLEQDEYERLKALALRSARDFERLYRSVVHKDDTTLAPRQTFYGDVPITARQMYEHTKNVNRYYFGEIGVEASNEPDIAACRLQAFERLERQANFLQNRVLNGSYGEQWTLRKVCRRFVWHDRIHAKAMARMASRLEGAEQLQNPFCF